MCNEWFSAGQLLGSLRAQADHACLLSALCLISLRSWSHRYSGPCRGFAQKTPCTGHMLDAPRRACGTKCFLFCREMAPGDLALEMTSLVVPGGALICMDTHIKLQRHQVVPQEVFAHCHPEVAAAIPDALSAAMQRGGLRVWRGNAAAGPKLFDLNVSREIPGHTGPVTSVALNDE
jgi:hypothetical protein